MKWGKRLADVAAGGTVIYAAYSLACWAMQRGEVMRFVESIAVSAVLTACIYWISTRACEFAESIKRRKDE